ncbi:MAG: hypothetical protein U0271_01920 [Polyangiaceae bacterium]
MRLSPAVSAQRGRAVRAVSVCGALFCFGVGVALGACGDDTTEPPPSDPVYGTTDCGTCVKTACSAEFTDCQSDPGCASYLECLLACPVTADGDATTECDAGCVADDSTESLKARSAITACRFEGRGAEDCADCNIPTGNTNPTLNQQCEPRPNAPNPCRQCSWDRCCDTWDACYADGVDPECNTLTDCAIACQIYPLEPCLADCFEAHPTAVDPFLSQLVCGLSLCANDQPNCDASLRDDCDDCMYDTCGDSFVAMFGSHDGFLLFTCAEDCGAAGQGIECTLDCVAAHPDGEEAFYVWTDCVNYHCASSC